LFVPVHRLTGRKSSLKPQLFEQKEIPAFEFPDEWNDTELMSVMMEDLPPKESAFVSLLFVPSPFLKSSLSLSLSLSLLFLCRSVDPEHWQQKIAFWTSLLRDFFNHYVCSSSFACLPCDPPAFLTLSSSAFSFLYFQAPYKLSFSLQELKEAFRKVRLSLFRSLRSLCAFSWFISGSFPSYHQSGKYPAALERILVRLFVSSLGFYSSSPYLTLLLSSLGLFVSVLSLCIYPADNVSERRTFQCPGLCHATP
jgi:hypothetical protein